MAGLRAVGADQVIDRRLAGGRAVLAVDVGLHAMFTGPGVEGLEEWPGTVDEHVHDGWSTVEVPDGSVLFAGLADVPFRFAHAYAARRFPLLETWPSDTRLNAPVVVWAQHDEPFVAAVENGPLTALQLRPELSGDAGATVLTRWVDSLKPGEPRMTDRLELLPAVDVADGQAVRLTQGAAGTETGYGDPLSAALDWYAGGAEWIHLVDLDAAFGRGTNAALLAEVTAELSGKGVKVELSGGIRDEQSVEWALSTGATRMNLGTAALENPSWTARMIGQYGDKIAVGLDVRGTTLAARGWTKDGGDLWEVLSRLEDVGCERYVVTDVTKDGMLNGPNVELLKQMCAKTDAPVVASGGVSSLEDIRVLRTLVPLGVEGSIVGKALYAGAFTLPEALDVAGRP